MPRSPSFGFMLGLAAGLGVSAMPTLLDAQESRSEVAERVATWYTSTLRSAPGQWGVAVADQNGQIIWSQSADEPMVPASTVKLLTTGFARSVLGSNARRATRVVGHGRADATGTWIGDWSLELNGDPSLERAEGTGPMLYDLALQLSKAGIRKLHGPLNVRSAEGPATAAYPAVWAARHQGRLFAPPVGPLTLHENIVWFTVQPGARSGKPARLTAAAPTGINSIVTMNAKTVAGRRSRLSIRERQEGGWTISGTIGVRAAPQRFTSVANNTKAILNATWDAALTRAGITWDRTAYPRPAANVPAKTLAEVVSAPLDSLAMEINRRSHNLGAELLLQWAGGLSRGPELLTAHVREVTGQTNGVHLVDGSGLSFEDRVTPRTFITYLAKFPATSAGRNFEQLLPANGTGTLRRLAAGLPEQGVVRAKTGTLSRTATVAGYLGRPTGRLLLSLMYTGDNPWAARQAQWKLFRMLGADGIVIPADSTEPPSYQLGGDSTRGE